MLQLSELRKIHHTACHCRPPTTVISELDFELRDESRCLRHKTVTSDLRDDSSYKEGHSFSLPVINVFSNAPETFIRSCFTMRVHPFHSNRGRNFTHSLKHPSVAVHWLRSYHNPLQIYFGPLQPLLSCMSFA